MLNDRPFQKEVDRIYEAFQAYLNSPPRLEDAPRTVYFCMEYGLHESLPFYAGGLGVLAGDHIKAASDLGIPMTPSGCFCAKDTSVSVSTTAAGSWPTIRPWTRSTIPCRWFTGRTATRW